MAALKLKSLNEQVIHKQRGWFSLDYYKCSKVNAETITRVNNLKYPVETRVPYFNKETQMTTEVKEVGIGDHDLRRRSLGCGKDRDMGLRTL